MMKAFKKIGRPVKAKTGMEFRCDPGSFKDIFVACLLA